MLYFYICDSKIICDCNYDGKLHVLVSALMKQLSMSEIHDKGGRGQQTTDGQTSKTHKKRQPDNTTSITQRYSKSSSPKASVHVMRAPAHRRPHRHPLLAAMELLRPRRNRHKTQFASLGPQNSQNGTGHFHDVYRGTIANGENRDKSRVSAFGAVEIEERWTQEPSARPECHEDKVDER